MSTVNVNILFSEDRRVHTLQRNWFLVNIVIIELNVMTLFKATWGSNTSQDNLLRWFKYVYSGCFRLTSHMKTVLPEKNIYENCDCQTDRNNTLKFIVNWNKAQKCINGNILLVNVVNLLYTCEHTHCSTAVSLHQL